MTADAMRGGDFLLRGPESVFCPEHFSEQQHLIAQTAERFAQDEIAPASDAIERQDFRTLRSLLRQAGELGLTGVETAEEYGGMGLDFSAACIVADHLAVQGSFSVAFGAHAGIATLPLVHFGSGEQKRRYLPRLASSEWIGAYALSEAGSGSDALAMRTEAVLEPGGGQYRLTGEKMWISNAGFADLFTVFAKVDGKPTAFLVESGWEGVSTGSEENKMGIHGSSTRALLLRNVRVPQENVLGGVGEGAHIAFQILNVGRLKLGAACLGGARNCLRQTIAYAKQRHAFGHPIADFGLIREQLARMAVNLFAAESAVYRTAALMDSTPRLDEFAIECSIVKVQASEMADLVVDGAVQVHGGNGFVRGNPAERAYRDARVNRIFEGANEINRLLIGGVALRRAQKGTLPLTAAVEEVVAGLLGPAEALPPLEQARRTVLMLAGLTARKLGAALEQEQVLLAGLADLMIALFIMQSVVLRAPDTEATRVIVSEGMDTMERLGRQVLARISRGDELRTQLAWLRRLLKREPEDVFSLRARIAERLLEAGKYAF
jgi:alkylation response protein AidB-like acyl-CoA dehydrogenase